MQRSLSLLFAVLPTLHRVTFIIRSIAAVMSIYVYTNAAEQWPRSVTRTQTVVTAWTRCRILACMFLSGVSFYFHFHSFLHCIGEVLRPRYYTGWSGYGGTEFRYCYQCRVNNEHCSRGSNDVYGPVAAVWQAEVPTVWQSHHPSHFVVVTHPLLHFN